MKLFGDGSISINLTNGRVGAWTEQYWTGSSSWDYHTYVRCSDIYDFEGTFAVSGNDISATLEVITTEENPDTFEMNFEINNEIQVYFITNLISYNSEISFKYLLARLNRNFK